MPNNSSPNSSNTKKSFSILSRLKNIRMPVFQLIFYSSLGYLGYIFYQDYHYKQLLKQIHSHSNTNQSKTHPKINPLQKVSQILHKIQQTQGKRQLKYLLKDFELNVSRYWTDSYKMENIIDFEMKQIQKSQQDKKIWWITPYITRCKLMTDYYHRSNVQKQGMFGLMFWFNYKTQQQNEMLQSRSICALISKAINLRRQKCEQFAINRKQQCFENEDKQIYECLKQSNKEIASLQKMKQRILTIANNQFAVKNKQQ